MDKYDGGEILVGRYYQNIPGNAVYKVVKYHGQQRWDILRLSDNRTMFTNTLHYNTVWKHLKGYDTSLYKLLNEG